MIKESLEKACAPLFCDETDLEKRLEILKDAFWMAHNSEFCDSMAGRLMAGMRTLPRSVGSLPAN